MPMSMLLHLSVLYIKIYIVVAKVEIVFDIVELHGTNDMNLLDTVLH